MKMNKPTLLALATALAVAAAPAAQAYNLCMSTPIASFDGFGSVSPDGRVLSTGGRLISVADLREIGRLPQIAASGGGEFSADSLHLSVLSGMEHGATRSGLYVVNVATPGAPPRHLDFTTGNFVRLSPNGNILSITPNETDRPDPDALGGQREYYTTQLLRTADGASLARIDRAYESKDWALDAKEQHAILFLSNFKPEGGEINLIDLQSGQIRRVPVNQKSGNVGISPDGMIAVTTDFDSNRTTFWDWASGNQLGTVANTGWLAFTPDSNWFFTEDIAVRRGDWSKPYRIPNLNQLDAPIESSGNRLMARLKDGTLVVLDAATLAPVFRSAAFGHRYWDAPKASAGNETIAWSSSTNEPDNDEPTLPVSNVVVLDGRSGNLLCRREIAPPAEFSVLGVTPQRVVMLETDGHQHYGVRIYAIESEDAARARVQREAAQAKATSAKLAPAKRAEAQGIFKQAFDLFQAGEFASAVKLFDAGLAIDPGNAPASYYLGETYTRLGDKDRAAAAYTRAAIIAPTSKEGALASTRLGN